MVSSYNKPTAQERRRMRSCGPPQMLGVEAPPWRHPQPSYLPPRFRTSPPGNYKAQTYCSSLRSYTLTVGEPYRIRALLNIHAIKLAV